MEQATLAGGCFWCTEAVFQRLKGVSEVIPGHSGGSVVNPTYEQVSTGKSGHAEAIQITFDPKVISYEQLLEVFWHLHDPTTLNRQAYDVGTQYRSAIFYHSDQQRKEAQESKVRLEISGVYKNPVVTEISPYINFYPAEKEHLDFYNKNRSSGYCRIIIDPKLQKLFKNYQPLLKDA